jgi:putative ABC transport system permease protein
MILNYIKIAWRNLTKQRLYSFINISGLAVGLAVCMMIMMYVAHEMSYDRFHKNADRIFQFSENLKIGGNDINFAGASYATGPMIQQNEPSVAQYMRVMKPQKDAIVESPLSPSLKFFESKMLFADAKFFKFFSFRLTAGDPITVLNKPFSIVISKDMAKKYFGDQYPIGKTLNIKTDSLTYLYQVTGVAENTPSNSSIVFDCIASNSSLMMMKESASLFQSQQIENGDFKTYILLKRPEDTLRVQHNLQSILKKAKGPGEVKSILTALPDIHLKFSENSNTKYLKIFPLVAGLILLLALVNYISLSTARSTLRAKEVAIRKVNGANRKTIALQFYIESTLFAVLSFILAYVLSYVFTPLLLNVLQLKIDATFFYSPSVLYMLLILLVVTILMAGSYPSIILSAYNPIATLKGKMSRQAGGAAVRKVFTTLQFIIAISLIICGIVIDRQLYYFRTTDTGVNRENIVMIPINPGFGNQYDSFKKEVQSIGGIQQVATSRYRAYKEYDMFLTEGETKADRSVMPFLTVDANFIQTLNIPWKTAPVSSDDLMRTKAVVINESARIKLKLPANPIGSFIKKDGVRYQVSGVVKNFNFGSMQYAIQPLCLFIAPNTKADWGTVGGCLFAKIKPRTNIPSVISAIQNKYKKYNGDTPFNFLFMDDAFNEQYKAEDRLASIFSVFTLITIALATLGLFGLAAFTIEQRTKEIGIRKVLGASLASINTLLSKDFLKLVVLAIVIASPIAWWAMHNWLQGFAYRITISWWVFAAAGFVAIITAIITVSYHAIRAAIANPVESLRSE